MAMVGGASCVSLTENLLRSGPDQQEDNQIKQTPAYEPERAIQFRRVSAMRSSGSGPGRLDQDRLERMTAMNCFAGLDVSLETTTICVVNQQGGVLHEVTVASLPDAIAAALRAHDPELVGLEAGPMSAWLHDGLSAHGFETVLMETRHVKAALRASLVKTDRRDARGIANLLRLGWFKPVDVKAASARERRVLLAARDTLARRMRDLDNAVRGLLRGFRPAAASAVAATVEPRRA
jgi:hypothetical protein